MASPITESLSWPPPWRRALGRRLAALVVLVALATGTAQLAGQHWVAELFSHFAPHYAAMAALLGTGLALARRWRWVLACVALLAINLWEIRRALPEQPWPASGYAALAQAGAAARAVRLLLWNVSADHPDPDRVLAWILEHEMALDVVVLLEVSPRWRPVVDALARFYPHVHRDVREDPYGLAVFSRLPDSRLRPLSHARSGLSSAVLTARTGAGAPFALWAMHPPPPLERGLANERNAQLVSVARTARLSSLPIVVAGDLNVTPWSPWFRELLSAGDLGLLSGGTPRGTWAPAWWPVDLGLPLDHVLGSRGIRARARLLGPRAGSSHRAVVVRFDVEDVSPGGAGAGYAPSEASRSSAKTSM